MDCCLNIKSHKDSGVHFGLLSLGSLWGSKGAGHEQPYGEAHVAQHGVKVRSPTACEERKPVNNQASEVRDGSLGPRPQLTDRAHRLTTTSWDNLSQKHLAQLLPRFSTHRYCEVINFCLVFL